MLNDSSRRAWQWILAQCCWVRTGTTLRTLVRARLTGTTLRTTRTTTSRRGASVTTLSADTTVKQMIALSGQPLPGLLRGINFRVCDSGGSEISKPARNISKGFYG